ncbi:ATP-binding protein [Caenimonas soli]|uniref:ATP-binding protein n=1 Tax=Caenimonas soli TaxID=2735555 RepID=UPI0015529AB9|nr:ATP-binding protein [Caenimonas soli]NPC56901.1 ATP-binding protein [Caenimonas soli]
MNTPSIYRDNILIEACGPILTEAALLRHLIALPPNPVRSSSWHRHLAMHEMQCIEEIFIPREVSQRLALTISICVRNGYRPRNPAWAATAAMLRGKPHPQYALAAPLMLSVCGISGSGKSKSLLRSAMQFPWQVVLHEKFPRVVGAFQQIIYLCIDVPPSGKLVDLAKELLRKTDEALGTDEFSAICRSASARPWDLFNLWLLVARRQFVGIVIFDEAQNLFKLETKRAREKGRKLENFPRELRLVEDETLKAILVIANTWKIPVAFSMTPDGMEAFNTRLAATQRLCGEGHYQFPLSASPDEEYFSKTLFPALATYQYLPKPMTIGPNERAVFYEETALVPRILIKAWRLGQRVAIEQGAKHFGVEHVRAAMATYLDPVRPAVKALLSKDPMGLRLYEDLLPPPKFWDSV